MITIQKLARVLADYTGSEDSPGSESHSIVIAELEKELEATLDIGWDKVWYVKVPVEVEREY